MTNDFDAGHRSGDGGARRRADLEIRGYNDPVPIGRGGFAVVYRAWQASFHRDVAIKVIDITLDPTAVDRFERECLAIGALSGHPNIVMVHELGLTADGRPFIVMEYLSGGTLADQIRSSPMPVARATAVGVALAGALASAHAAGVLHRDVKPENVLVSRFGETKLGDFGIARIEGRTETRTGSITASLAHAAPEVLAGQRPSVASDLYSLGSTLFTLLSGTPAFVRDTDESFLPLVTRVASEPVPDLRPAGVPDPVCRVVEQSMAKDPSERQSSAAELGRQLQAAQAEAGLPVTPLVLEVEDPLPQTEGFTVSIRGPLPGDVSGAGHVAHPDPVPAVAAGPSGPAAGGEPPPPAPTVPVLDLSDDVVDLGDVDPDAGPPTESIYVRNRGAGTLDWTVRTEADWVDVDRQEGFFTMTFRPRPGTNQATVVVYDRNSGAAKTIRVRARVPTSVAPGGGEAAQDPAAADAGPPAAPPLPPSPPPDPSPPVTTAPPSPPAPAPPRRRSSRRGAAISVVLTLLVVAVVVVALAGGGGDSRGGGSGGGGPSGGTDAPNPNVTTIAVSGTDAWTDTGLDVEVGDTLDISATGEVHYHGEYASGPDGKPDAPELHQFNVIPDANHGALIGRIGEGGDPVVVGSSDTVVAPAAGRVFLGINDTAFDDNSGSYTATIEKRPAG